MADITNNQKLEIAICAMESLTDEMKLLGKKLPVLEMDIIKAILLYIASNPDAEKMSHKKLEYFACAGSEFLQNKLVEVLDVRLKRRLLSAQIDTMHDTISALQTLIRTEHPL